MSLMFEPLRKYADFKGRARRSEFWLFWLFLVIMSVVLQVVVTSMPGGAAGLENPSFGPESGLLGIVLLAVGIIWLGLIVPSLAVAVRRLHDTNRSGWWILIGLIPLLGAVVLFVFYVLDGTPGPNKYGEDPKNREAEGGAVAAA